MKLQYTLGIKSDIRVYRNLAWREYNWDSEIICESAGFGDDLNDEIKNQISAFVKPAYGTEVYIRFNELPKDGKSRNWATNQTEKGISVYNTTYDLETGTYQTYGALPGAELAYLIKGANVYFVTGECVGKGSDGEPLLTNVKILGKATYTKTGYKA